MSEDTVIDDENDNFHKNESQEHASTEKTKNHPLGGHQPHVPNILSHENDVEPEIIIHPGGSQNLDIHKVEVLGAASVVQEPSSIFPDQDCPEKYLNTDSDLLQDIVEVNLWYKDTKKMKHNRHKHNHP